MNKAIILGRLGADPESSTTTSGKTVCKLSVATSEYWTDRDGTKQEKTDWHKVVCWDELAINCNRFLTKGRQVLVEGKIQTRSWEDQQGQKKYTTEIIASSVEFVGDKKEKDSGPSFDSNEPLPF